MKTENAIVSALVILGVMLGFMVSKAFFLYAVMLLIIFKIPSLLKEN